MQVKSTFPILVVDDDAAIVPILERVASEVFSEAQFINAQSFAEAAHYLDRLRGFGPSLVLLDIDLAMGPSGLDFLKLLRNHPQGRLLPVIMLSVSQSREQMDEAYSLGANAFTSKPFSLAEWRTYVGELRTYWYTMARIPTLYFTDVKQA
ncbi:hypothetical protein GCM10028805_17720 [Spirosoma harenae]